MARAIVPLVLTKAMGGFLILFVMLQLGFAADDHDTAKRLKDAGKIIPLERLLDGVRKERSGRLLGVELREHEGQLVYDVEFVDAQGVVWYLQYDATQGTLLRTRKDTTR